MEFLLGCNYWASNAGAEMWDQFDIQSVDKDLQILSRHGVRHIRVFPNWKDFQPVMPIYTDAGTLAEFRLVGDRKKENPYYLDEKMLCRFSEFLDLCEKYGIRVIVGLITGWMSGRLFVPPALYGKNVITDPLAQYFQQLFIQGFIARFKDRPTILAWDLGNECNSMGPVTDRWQAANWTATVTNAIRSADPTRPVISGMHNLDVKGNWQLQDQALFTDILTTHPYPYWSEHTRIDKNRSFRTSLHPTAQTKFYGEIGGKPCFAEETGTMGPMLCSDESAADFIRINMFSLWANGSIGYMWWCACDQDHLTTFPYTAQMVETELGMVDGNGNPKPVLKQMKQFSDFLQSFPAPLPKAREDAVCILSQTQDQWGVGYMTYLLARQAGFNCRFAYSQDTIPQSDLYLLPSINQFRVMPKENYLELKRRVREGADLYISLDDGILSGFEDLTGLKVLDSYQYAESDVITLDDQEIPISRNFTVITKSVGAEVLATDSHGNPVITVHSYGKGRVFFVAFPLERNLIGEHEGFSGHRHLIYRRLFDRHIASYPLHASGDGVVLTYHPREDGTGIAVILNHSEQPQALSLRLDPGLCIDSVLYGALEVLPPFDACVIQVKPR